MTSEGSSEIAVVGGGLVGSLLSIYLVRRGHEVTVYERRPDLRAVGHEGGRSINLVLTRRGLRALEGVGLAQAALRLTVPVTGRMMHSVEGELAYQPYGRDDSECNYSISRGGLNEFLVREAQALGVQFRFRARLVHADFESNRLGFVDEADRRSFVARPRVVFGTDGAGSAVRRAMMHLDGFEESIEMLEHGYKELEIAAGDGGEFRIEKHALHIWPRGDLMMMALPNLDGSFTVTLYMPHAGPRGFRSVRSPEEALTLFREQFPDSIPLIADLERSFLSNPTGSLGTVRCRPWHHRNRVLLLGDAAHGIVPFFGQGMNCGFEDCTVLGGLFDRFGKDDWSEAFAELDRRRKTNADAIADMALENFVEMRNRVGDDRFLLRKRVEHRLEQEIPSEYRSRYSMVMYSHIPYRTAFEAGRIQEEILDELCNGLDSEQNLDPAAARRLIETRLTPFLRSSDVSLEY